MPQSSSGTLTLERPDAATDHQTCRGHELESVACPVCGCSNNRLAFEFSPFRVVECDRCSSGYLSPRLRESAMRRVYEEGYYSTGEGRSTGYDNYQSLEDGLRRTCLGRYRKIRPWTKGGCVVEIGCAFGYSLDCLSNDFAERIGIDVAPEAIEAVIAKGHWGHCGTLESADLPDGSADLVLCMETIEHIYEPRSLARQIGRVLKPGGIAAMVTPDFHSLLRRASGRQWVSFKIPEHVTYFSRAGMRRMLNEAGMDVVRVQGDRQYSPWGMVLDRAAKVWPTAARIANAVSRPILAPTSFIPVYNGMFLVIARKR